MQSRRNVKVKKEKLSDLEKRHDLFLMHNRVGRQALLRGHRSDINHVDEDVKMEESPEKIQQKANTPQKAKTPVHTPKRRPLLRPTNTEEIKKKIH